MALGILVIMKKRCQFHWWNLEKSVALKLCFWNFCVNRKKCSMIKSVQSLSNENWKFRICPWITRGFVLVTLHYLPRTPALNDIEGEIEEENVELREKNGEFGQWSQIRRASWVGLLFEMLARSKIKAESILTLATLTTADLSDKSYCLHSVTSILILLLLLIT